MGEILLIFRSRKYDFAESWNPRLKGTMRTNFRRFSSLKFRFLPIRETNVLREECKNFLPFWGLKMRFYLFVISTFQGYQAACQEIWLIYQFREREIFCILAVWKCDCCRFVKLTFQGTTQRVGIFFMLRPENAILSSREIHVSKVPSFVVAIFPQVPSFVWTNYPHFVCRKMRFLPIGETNVSRYLAKRRIF